MMAKDDCRYRLVNRKIGYHGCSNNHIAFSVILVCRIVFFVQVFDRIGKNRSDASQTLEPFSAFVKGAEDPDLAALNLSDAIDEIHPSPPLCDVLCPEECVVDHQDAAATADAALVDCAFDFAWTVPCPSIVVAHQGRKFIHKGCFACIFCVRQFRCYRWRGEDVAEGVYMGGGGVRDDDRRDEGEQRLIHRPCGFCFHVLQESLGDKARARQQERQRLALLCGRGAGEVYLAEQRGERRGEEPVHALSMSVGAAFALPRHGHFDMLPQDGLVLRDHADIGRAFAQHNRPQLRPPVRVACLFQHLQRYAVPPVRLLQCEFAVEFEIERVVLSHLHVLVLRRHLACHVHLARSDVEVRGRDCYCQVECDALGRHRSGVRRLGDPSDCLRAYMVVLLDKVVGVPLEEVLEQAPHTCLKFTDHVFRLLWQQSRRTRPGFRLDLGLHKPHSGGRVFSRCCAVVQGFQKIVYKAV
jgi:hypothetical protein